MSYDVLSTGQTKFDADPRSLTKQPRGRKMRIYADTYEAAALDAASTIHMFTLPKGFTMVRGQLIADALGSGVTLAIGDGTTADDFLVATASNTDGKTTALTFAADAMTSLDADTDVVITTAGAAATGTIYLEIEGYMILD